MWPLVWMLTALAAAVTNGEMMPMQKQPPQQMQQPGAVYGHVGGGASIHGDADKGQLSLGGGYVSRGIHKKRLYIRQSLKMNQGCN